MRIFLLLLLGLIAIASTASGFLMISDPEGGLLKLNTELLEGTPFKDFRWPGILLVLLVGGVSTTAIYSHMTRSSQRYSWSIASGVVMIGWLVGQLVLINAIHWLHFLLFGMAAIIILLSYQLKGKWAV